MRIHPDTHVYHVEQYMPGPRAFFDAMIIPTKKSVGFLEHSFAFVFRYDKVGGGSKRGPEVGMEAQSNGLAGPSVLIRPPHLPSFAVSP